MNPTILSPVMGWIVGQTGTFTLVWQPVLKKENSEFKTPFKIDLVTDPAGAEELGKHSHNIPSPKENNN